MASTWKFLDVGKLERTHCYLSDNERLQLYNKLTKTFTIDDNNNYKTNGLPSPKIGCKISYQSLGQQIQTIIYYFIITFFFFLPAIYILLAIYFIYYAYYTQFIIYLIIYSILAFYPIKENKSIIRNKYVYNQLRYFSYRMSIHEDTYNYMKTTHKDVIFMAMPHGTLPLTTIISPLIHTDIYEGNDAVGTAASIIFYVPIIRNFAHWFGAQSVSKSSIKNILLNAKKCVGIMSDGISGIFVQSQHLKYENCEVVLLKKRKGIAKIALECGVTGVCPTYGFGNCQVYKCWFDKYGILRWLSQKLKMSLIIMYGRWYLWIPQRIPLYNVTGPIVKNKYANNPILKPTQEQIDEYHERILKAAKLLFDQHKQIYGWNSKELVFV
eukprot:481584_1